MMRSRIAVIVVALAVAIPFAASAQPDTITIHAARALDGTGKTRSAT
ncbi:MAG: hypothetical protein M3Z17_03565 [Gemmatimonadota bacterium]|nr:hypothetical protein [Gemmatimonadota bacterium]